MAKQLASVIERSVTDAQRTAAAESERNERTLSDSQFTGNIIAVRGNRVDVETTNADGKRRVVRDVFPAQGYARAYIGDTVGVRRLSDGRNVADAVTDSAGIGGRGAAFWARVTQVFNATRPLKSAGGDTTPDTETVPARIYATPLKDPDGNELLAYATAGLGAVSVGDEVWVVRDDGGYTEGGADSFNELYFAQTVRQPSDYYDRLSGRPQEAITQYQDVKVGTSTPSSAGNGVRARSIRLVMREGGGTPLIPAPSSWTANWLDSNALRDTPFSVDDYEPQYWRTPIGLDEMQVEILIIVETVNQKDRVEVTGGVRIDPIGEDSTDDISDDSFVTGKRIGLLDPPKPFDTPENAQERVANDAWERRTKRSYDRWHFRGIAARLVSVFWIDVHSDNLGKSARYTLVLERNQPYGEER